jgi:hypothetical protein
MSSRFTILLAVVRPPYLLPFAIESVLAQTVRDFELLIVCDGAPPETVECGHAFAQRDPRVQVRAFPKGTRQGEAHLAAALAGASGEFVAYLEDDDFWFPNHLQALQDALLTADFCNTIHVTGYPDGRVEALPCDLARPEFRQRFLEEVFNRFGYTFCGHTLEAYRRLPEGWAPTPVGIYPDLHMWRKFLRMNEFRFATCPAITAIALPGHVRGHMSLAERARETGVWAARVRDEHERARIVEDAWRSVMKQEIQCEQENFKLNALLRETKTTLAQLEGMHPGSLQQLGRTIEVETSAQVEVERLQAVYHLSQHALSVATARTEAQETAIAAYQAELAHLKRSLAELSAAHERVVRSKSWLLTRPLRSAVAAARRILQIVRSRR